jgi:hypothetical protein
MGRFLLCLSFACSLSFLNACGGGNTQPPPPPITVDLSPSTAQAPDASRGVSFVATANNDSGNLGVNWTVVFPAGVNTCGAMAFGKLLWDS